MTSTHTRITSVNEFDATRLVFSKPNKNDKLGSWRVNVGYRNSDNTIGELIIPVNWPAYTFGVGENRAKVGDELQGYQISICMYDQAGPTDDQLEWVRVYNEIVEACKDFLVTDDVKKEIKKPRLSKALLEDLCKALYWKRDEDGNVVEGRGPTLYPKLITKRFNDEPDEMKKFQIDTLFADENGNDLSPKELVGIRGRVQAAIKFESIHIAAFIRLQVKATEVEFMAQNRRAPRLFIRDPPVVQPVVMEEAVAVVEEDADDEENDVVLSEEDNRSPTPPPQKIKKGGRRLLAKK